MSTQARPLLPHMREAVKSITARLRLTEVVIEMRDARTPFSSENYLISNLIATKRKKLLLLSKSDLAHTVNRKVLPSLVCGPRSTIDLLHSALPMQ